LRTVRNHLAGIVSRHGLKHVIWTWTSQDDTSYRRVLLHVTGLTLTRPCARVQVLTILVPFIRETRHLDVCPETGSGQRSGPRSADRRGAIVRSARLDLSHVSASCLRGRGQGQRTCLAGSSGTGTGLVYVRSLVRMWILGRVSS